MKEWKVILATLVIFGAGVVTGALVVNLSQRPRMQRPLASALQQPQNLRAPWHEQRYEYIRQIDRKLELSPEQRESMERIVRESQMRTKNLWDSVAPKMNEELKKVREDIRQLLTPDQRKQFEKLSELRGPGQRKPEDFLWREDRPRVQPQGSPPGERPRLFQKPVQSPDPRSGSPSNQPPGPSQ